MLFSEMIWKNKQRKVQHMQILVIGYICSISLNK